MSVTILNSFNERITKMKPRISVEALLKKGGGNAFREGRGRFLPDVFFLKGKSRTGRQRTMQNEKEATSMPPRFPMLASSRQGSFCIYDREERRGKFLLRSERDENRHPMKKARDSLGNTVRGKTNSFSAIRGGVYQPGGLSRFREKKRREKCTRTNVKLRRAIRTRRSYP